MTFGSPSGSLTIPHFSQALRPVNTAPEPAASVAALQAALLDSTSRP